MAKYARGHAAWGICGRSGIKMLLKDMVFDGRFPNMRVHPDWFEPKDPLDYAPRVDDPIALWRPAPDNWHLTPPDLRLTNPTDTTVDLTWTASISDAYQTSQYSIYFRLFDGDEHLWQLYATYQILRDMYGAITYEPLFQVVTLPQPGQLYQFFVAATDTGHLSANSNIVSMFVIDYAEALDASSDFISGEMTEIIYAYLTSRIYPIEVIEALEAGASARNQPQTQINEAMDLTSNFMSGELRVALLTYLNYKAEAFDLSSDFLSGELRVILISYLNYKAEAMDLSSNFLSGELRQTLLLYSNYKAEALDLSANFLSGALT